MKLFACAMAALILLSEQPSCAGFDLSSECRGNLVLNGGFEEPNTEVIRSEVQDVVGAGPKWGWYSKIPGAQCGTRHMGSCALATWC